MLYLKTVYRLTKIEGDVCLQENFSCGNIRRSALTEGSQVENIKFFTRKRGEGNSKVGIDKR